MWFRFVGLILFVLPCAAQVTSQTAEPQFTLISDVQYSVADGCFHPESPQRASLTNFLTDAFCNFSKSYPDG